MTKAIVIAAPSSGAGKTVISLGIMAALRVRGLRVGAAKCGPDYIDPAFHTVATGQPSVNLDPWAMSPNELRGRARDQACDFLIIEAAMGVLDASADGRGSAADLAEALGVPAVLIIDIAKTGQSAALAPAGLASLRPALNLAGVIFNRCGSPRHKAIAEALLPCNTPLFGTISRDPSFILPERHLGLVQASETVGIATFLDHIGAVVERNLDLDAILDAAMPVKAATDEYPIIPALGQRIAVAMDRAFAFSYPHMLSDWAAAGAQILPFSPLNDEAPDASADAIFLPGGYPELHAGTLAAAQTFRSGMQGHAASGATIYGECGGFMTLGDALIDTGGVSHEMLGLLPLSTSFQNRKMSLGYRKLSAKAGPFSGDFFAHEFHYATITHEGDAARMFTATDALDGELPDLGLVRGNIAGSFAHLIAPAPTT